MELIQKINSINRIYRQLAIQTSSFKKESCLSCKANCSACCLKPDIEATVLEFLPAAYDLYKRDAYEPVLESIEHSPDQVCVFYNPFNEAGGCTIYPYRGLICRLFGFSSNLDKYGNRVLVSCRYIKESADPVRLQHSIGRSPDMTAWYMKLYGVDHDLAIRYYPVNQAVKKALEIVLLYFHYRKKPA